MTSLGKALLESLKIDAPNFYYGISCPCCDSAAYYWYLQNVKSSNVTFSNIWLNGNFKTFQKNFLELERDAVLITNWHGKGKTYGKLNVKRHYFVSDDCVKFFEEDCGNLMRQIIDDVGPEKNLLYVVSAGPLSNVIIAELFKHNPDNCYVDFGSATDLMNHDCAEKNCWMFDRKKISLDVDVVLTCYKCPQVLAQQLAAIKNQTFKPRRIFLYQDGIDGYYKIELNDKILSEFDACKISAKNFGVWKRFEFAEEICKSPYVCLFDDDTIPGLRWLENCHMNMMQRRGIYGTNGVLLTKPEDYPQRFLKAGWHTANRKTCAVDLVGHSWFFERECLAWMLAEPWSKKYKLVGEDMTLSVAATEHDIKTYVPQHPKNILSLWGSLPKSGRKYGTDEAAISMNPANLQMMREAVKEIYSDGRKCLLEQNPEYLNEFSAALEPRPQPSPDLNKLLKDGTRNLFPLLAKKPPIFLGERKAQSSVQKLFGLQAKDYHVLENERYEIETTRLFEAIRQGAIHIFFTDIYNALKPFLNQWGLREGIDYIDGRGLIVATI